MTNPYRKLPDAPMAYLPDGRALYPAYEVRLRGRERFRRSLSRWNGSTGERVGVTADGQLYRRMRLWGSGDDQPYRWEGFHLGGTHRC